MNTFTYKTTIKCSGCVATVTPVLNKIAGENNWKVDIDHPGKILRIETDKKINDKEIIDALEKLGYKAESVQ